MNRREKILAILVSGVTLLLGGTLVIKAWFVKPLKEADRQTMALREKLRQINDERRAFFTAEDYLKGVVQHTFGRDVDNATAQAGKMITDQIVRLGLLEKEFYRMPVPPHKLRGTQEVGWSVQGEGPMSKMIDLLFVLEQSPQVHRLENLVVSAGDRPGRIKLRFRYLTLVVDAAPETSPIQLKPALALDSQERRFCEMIVQRDLLRPYVKRRSTPVETIAVVASTQSGPQPEMLKVVSLTEWQGLPEVHICDLSNQSLQRFKPGDSFGGGQIVMVDYRNLPLPDKPQIISNSRVILKIGSDYWAIEQGQTLANKYQVQPDRLPPFLSR